MSRHTSLRTCFLAYPFDRDVRLLRQALEELGIEVREGSTEPGSLPVADAVQRRIAESDITIAVLGGRAQDTSVMYELGVARGLGKPTLVVTLGRTTVPAALNGLRILPLTSRSEKTIRSALARALNVAVQPPQNPSPGEPSSRSLGPAADTYLARLRRMEKSPAASSELGVVRLLASALAETGAVVELNAGHRRGADLAVWLPDLESTVGNPLLVEVKWRVALKSAAFEQMRIYMSDAGVRWGLLVLGRSQPTIRLQARVQRNGILVAQLRDLLSELRTSNLGQVVARLRNSAVHSAQR